MKIIKGWHTLLGRGQNINAWGLADSRKGVNTLDRQPFGRVRKVEGKIFFPTACVFLEGLGQRPKEHLIRSARLIGILKMLASSNRGAVLECISELKSSKGLSELLWL